MSTRPDGRAEAADSAERDLTRERSVDKRLLSTYVLDTSSTMLSSPGVATFVTCDNPVPPLYPIGGAR